jgi:sugar phosphate isomerase/epimerase
MPTPRIAYQLYSARVPSAADFGAVLGAIGHLGYDGVEFAGLHGHDADVVRGWTDAAELDACAVHTSVAKLEADTRAVVEEAKALGTDRVILAHVPAPTSASEAAAAADLIGTLGQSVESAGGRFAFHNHASELVSFDGASTIDRLVAASPSLGLEIDLGWAWIADVDPLELLRSLPGRVPLVHVKDFTEHDSDTCCPIGEGLMAWAELLPATAATAGLEWMVVEQDETAGDELDEAARSLAGMRRLLGS